MDGIVQREQARRRRVLHCSGIVLFQQERLSHGARCNYTMLGAVSLQFGSEAGERPIQDEYHTLSAQNTPDTARLVKPQYKHPLVAPNVCHRASAGRRN